MSDTVQIVLIVVAAIVIVVVLKRVIQKYGWFRASVKYGNSEGSLEAGNPHKSDSVQTLSSKGDLSVNIGGNSVGSTITTNVKKDS